MAYALLLMRLILSKKVCSRINPERSLDAYQGVAEGSYFKYYNLLIVAKDFFLSRLSGNY